MQCFILQSAGCSVASSCRGALAAWSGQEVHESEQHSAAGQRHDHTQVPSDDDDDSVDDDMIIPGTSDSGLEPGTVRETIRTQWSEILVSE